MYAAYIRIVHARTCSLCLQKTPRLPNSQTPENPPKQNYNNYNNFCPTPVVCARNAAPPLYFHV